MSYDLWKNAKGGYWDDALDWAHGVPSAGAGQIAVLPNFANDTPYTVTIADDKYFNDGVQMDIESSATLKVTTDISDNFSLNNAGTFKQVDTLLPGETGVEFGSPGVIVTNSGTIEVVGANLKDNDNMVMNTLRLVNTGFIELAGAGASIVIVDAVIVNKGSIVGTGKGAYGNQGIGEAGQIDFSDDTINNAGGVIGTTSASKGDCVFLDGGCTIDGGTLEGLIFAETNVNTLLSNVTFAAGTRFNIDGNYESDDALAGTISNQGVISISTMNKDNAILAIEGVTTLTGSGTIDLGDADTNGPYYNQIVNDGNYGKLDNVDNLIEGQGLITSSSGQLVIDNERGGTIEAFAVSVLQANLKIFTGAAIANAGMIETSKNASLWIEDAIDNTGTIYADGQLLLLSGQVYGAGTDKINGATLEFQASVSSQQTIMFDGIGTLALDDPLQFHGAIEDFKIGGPDVIDLFGFNNSTLKPLFFQENSAHNGGTLVVSDGTHKEYLSFLGGYKSGDFQHRAGNGFTAIY